jgi:hypothetical protein
MRDPFAAWATRFANRAELFALGPTTHCSWRGVAGRRTAGDVQLLQGLFGNRRPPKLDNAGYAELEAATLLEAQGRLPDAIALYKMIAERYPSAPVATDARKSLESLEAKLK